MNKDLRESIEIICITIMCIGFVIGCIVANNQDEQIKQLEQQIQEKQVYINILEREEK